MQMVRGPPRCKCAREIFSVKRIEESCGRVVRKHKPVLETEAHGWLAIARDRIEQGRKESASRLRLKSAQPLQFQIQNPLRAVRTIERHLAGAAGFHLAPCHIDSGNI